MTRFSRQPDFHYVGFEKEAERGTWQEERIAAWKVEGGNEVLW
jgi:hypothetical protein